MYYILRSTQHKTMIRQGEYEDILDEYRRRIEKFPRERFEIITAAGELVNVEDIATGRFIGRDTEIRTTVSEDTGGELSSSSEYNSEPPTDSTD